MNSSRWRVPGERVYWIAWVWNHMKIRYEKRRVLPKGDFGFRGSWSGSTESVAVFPRQLVRVVSRLEKECGVRVELQDLRPNAVSLINSDIHQAMLALCPPRCYITTPTESKLLPLAPIDRYQTVVPLTYVRVSPQVVQSDIVVLEGGPPAFHDRKMLVFDTWDRTFTLLYFAKSSKDVLACTITSMPVSPFMSSKACQYLCKTREDMAALLFVFLPVRDLAALVALFLL